MKTNRDIVKEFSKDWGVGNREPYNQFTKIYYRDWVQRNYRPYPAQEKIYMFDKNKPNNKRGYAVMTGIRPWDDKPLSEAKKQAGMKPLPPIGITAPPTDPET